MIIKLKEARKYLCPYRRVHGNYASFLNCYGNACMMWTEKDKVKGTGYCGLNASHSRLININK